MKILHAVQFYHPAKGGMEEVVKQLSTRLTTMGHDVTVVTSTNPMRKNKIIDGVNIIDFNISGNIAKGIKGEHQAYRDFLKNSHFDIITCFAAQQWSTDIILEELDNISGKKVFVPTGFSGLYMNEYEKYFQEMPKWMNKFDINVFLSNDYRDINFAREHNISKTIIIPNGACEKEFNYSNKDNFDRNKKVLLHVGNHTGQKGHKELIKIFSKANIQDVDLFIVGEKKWKSPCYIECLLSKTIFNIWFKIIGKNKKIYIKNLSREELIKLYHRANLFILPSNIECSPLVLFEAMASQTAFLTSDVGNAKEIIEWSNGGELLPTIKNQLGRSCIQIQESIPILERMINDNSYCDNIAKKGKQSWIDHFSWEKISKKYEELYLELLNE